jgi:hypothetical protein
MPVAILAGETLTQLINAVGVEKSGKERGICKKEKENHARHKGMGYLALETHAT